MTQKYKTDGANYYLVQLHIFLGIKEGFIPTCYILIKETILTTAEIKKRRKKRTK